VGIFQEVLDAMHQRGPLPDQGAAIPREVAQRALGHGWNTAGAPHPMLQKLGQPGGSFDVRLASRSQVDLLRMDEKRSGCPAACGGGA
jgi:hypothetical protein